MSVEAKTLQSHLGQYGVRHVTFDQGSLWYQRAADAEKIPLPALSATEFAGGEGQRFQFVVTNGGVDGAHVAYARHGAEQGLFCAPNRALLDR